MVTQMKRKKSRPGLVLLVVTIIGITISMFADAYGKELNINIHEEFSPTLVGKVIPVIEQANEGDIININIDSPGGRLDSYYAILFMLNNSKATTSCTVNGQAASAAAALLVNCDIIKVAPNSTILFHLPYAQIENFIHRDPHVSKSFVISMNKKLNLRTLLGEEKYIDMLYGYDILISGREFNQRLLLARLQ